jgi:hypothetical protein
MLSRAVLSRAEPAAAARTPAHARESRDEGEALLPPPEPEQDQELESQPPSRLPVGPRLVLDEDEPRRTFAATENPDGSTDLLPRAVGDLQVVAPPGGRLLRVPDFCREVGQALRAGKTLPAPRRPAELAELEQLIAEKGGLDAVVAYCCQVGLEREAEYGPVTKAGYFLPILRGMPAPAAPPEEHHAKWLERAAQAASEDDPRWGELVRRLGDTLRRDLFDRWFGGLRAQVVGEQLLLAAPDDFHANFLRDQYAQRILALASEAQLGITSVTVGVALAGLGQATPAGALA